MKKVLSLVSMTLLAIALVACGSKSNAEIDLNDVLDKVNIGYQATDSFDKVTQDLILPTKVDGLDAVTIVWSSSDTDVLVVEHQVGKITRGETDQTVILTATAQLGDDAKPKPFNLTILKMEDVASEPNPEEGLAYHFDFSSLDENTTYVSELTDFEATNKISGGSNLIFQRLNANISTESTSGAKGIVLGVRKNNGWATALLQTKIAIEDLTQIEVSYVSWGKTDQQNLDYVKGIFIQISSDGQTWTTVKDMKPEIENTDFYAGTASVSVTKATQFVRIYAESVGEQSTTFQMRFIVKELKLYSPLNGTTTPPADGDDGSAEPDPTDSTEQTVTATYSGETSKMTEGNNAALIGLDASIFTVTTSIITTSTYTNPIGLNKDGSIRLYSDRTTGNGNILSISIQEGYEISNIEFTFGAGKSASDAILSLDNQNITLTGTDLTEIVKTYSNISAQTISLQNTFQAETGSNQIWITSIKITYKTNQLA